MDVALTGFDAQFLLDNESVPVAPVLPLVPEAIGLSSPPLVLSTTPPAIVTAAAASVAENAALAVVLKADDGQVRWTITGGTDAALFEIIKTGGASALRWLADAPKDYEAPVDANTDNVYQVQVTATNPLGYASALAISVTVRDKQEGVVSPFTDSFNRANEDIEISPNWRLAGGEAGRLAVASNALTIPAAGAAAAYVSPDTGSADHYAQIGSYGDQAQVAVSVTDDRNYIGLARSGGNVVLRTCVAGVVSTLGTWAGAGNSVLRLEYAGGVATAKRNGVTLGAVAITGGPPSTTRAGLVAAATSGSPGTLVDNFESGAL